MQADVPVKPRRKKLDVPVHRTERQGDVSVHKTFSANYPSRIADEKQSAKISKRHLIKENEVLNEQNLELQEKLSSMDVYLNKKLTRLKEKLNNLQKVNEEVVNENNTIKVQYQQMLVELNNVKKELTQSKCCQNCEHLSRLIDKAKAECSALKATNTELLEDENMLKNVIYRLNMQLEVYQEKFHKHRIKLNSSLHEVVRADSRENMPTISPR